MRQDQKAQPVAIPAGALVGRVINLTLTEPPGEGDALDRPRDRRHRGIAALGSAHLNGAPLPAPPGAALQAFQGSTVPAKLRDVVGLYLEPPARSLVLSVEKKSQVQAPCSSPGGLPPLCSR